MEQGFQNVLTIPPISQFHNPPPPFFFKKKREKKYHDISVQKIMNNCSIRIEFFFIIIIILSMIDCSSRTRHSERD